MCTCAIGELENSANCILVTYAVYSMCVILQLFKSLWFVLKKKKGEKTKPNYIAKPLFVPFIEVKVKSHWLLPGKLVILFKARKHQLYKGSVQTDLHLYFQSNLLPLPTMNFMFPLFCRLVVPWICMHFHVPVPLGNVFSLLKCCSLYLSSIQFTFALKFQLNQLAL